MLYIALAYIAYTVIGLLSKRPNVVGEVAAQEAKMAEISLT